MTATILTATTPIAAAGAPERYLVDLLLIVAAGLAANLVCRRLGVSSIVGYLIIGAALGDGALNLIGPERHEIELFAEAGVFLLLFTVGIEFSLEELRALSWRLPVGGAVQMLLVAAPAAVVFNLLGLEWRGAMMLAAATAFSSTVLVFKALAEVGQASTPHGGRAIGVLLFQDVALVPLLLVTPLLTGDSLPTAGELGRLIATTTAFVAVVAISRRLVSGWLIPHLTSQRSPDLIVLMTVVMLGAATLAAYAAGLPPAIGAFAAGLLCGGNRWSPQIDALVLPFRETFAAVFFVSLGLLLDVGEAMQWPLLVVASAAAVIAVKTLAAATALRLTGLGWRASLGMGLGLSQIGEFAFLLARTAREKGLIADSDYQRLASVALVSLVLTPLLLRRGLRWTDDWWKEDDAPGGDAADAADDRPGTAVVIGAGPVGQQVASYLETRGVELAIVDRSPVNLYPFSQTGMHTVAGDATDPQVLRSAHLPDASLVVVAVSADEAARSIVQQTRRLHPQARILVRCRFQSSVRDLRRLGAEMNRE
ncbi:MAG: cation:proton antiporter [Planctomycetota bacterium]